ELGDQFRDPPVRRAQLGGGQRVAQPALRCRSGGVDDVLGGVRRLVRRQRLVPVGEPVVIRASIRRRRGREFDGIVLREPSGKSGPVGFAQQPDQGPQQLSLVNVHQRFPTPVEQFLPRRREGNGFPTCRVPYQYRLLGGPGQQAASGQLALRAQDRQMLDRQVVLHNP